MKASCHNDRRHWHAAGVASVRLLSLVAVAMAILTAFVWWLSSRKEEVPRPQALAETALFKSGATSDEQRQSAALQLSRHPDAPVAELRQVFQQADTPEVKAAAALGLGRCRDWESMPGLIEAMDAPSPWLREQAALAVNRIVGEDFGFRADAPDAERRRVIEVVRFKWPILYRGYKIKEQLLASGQQPTPKKKRGSRPPGQDPERAPAPGN